MNYTVNPTLLPFFEKENRTPPYITYDFHDLYPRKVLSLHCHKHAEIGICLEGSGYNYIENRIYRFQKGDIEFVSAYTPHLATSDNGVISKWIWISIDITGLFDYYFKESNANLLLMQENLFNGMFHPEEHEKLSALINELFETLKNPSKFSLWKELFLIGEIFLEIATIGDIDSQGVLSHKKSMTLYPIILYIHKNYNDKSLMKEENLAKISQYSVSHFRYLFKKETGLSVQKFILQLRLSYAAHVLANTNESILDVALESGFGNISYFNKAFANAYHCSPSVYRKTNKKRESTLIRRKTN